MGVAHDGCVFECRGSRELCCRWFFKNQRSTLPLVICFGVWIVPFPFRLAGVFGLAFVWR